MNSQCADILDHMRNVGPITGLEALRQHGCIHLPRRILDLKERGHAIESEFVVLPNGKRVKSYWLKPVAPSEAVTARVVAGEGRG